jgi:hypothetical protein
VQSVRQLTRAATTAPAAARPLEALRRLDGWIGVALVLVAALASFATQSLIWPLQGGRDWQDYLLYWYELRQAEPLFPGLMLGRTPLAPVFFGPLFELGGAGLAEAGAGVLYAVAVVLWVATARYYGFVTAAVTALVLVCIPTYGWFFHQLGSDPVFAAVLALVAWVAHGAARRPSMARFAALGASVVALVLARPSGQPFLLLVLLPLGLAVSWRRRAGLALAFIATAAVGLLAWSAHNAIRFDDFTVARGGRGGIPLYRAFVVDRIVEPENGPATRELAAAIERDLVQREPYRSWGFDAEEVLTSANTWVSDDLPPLADRTWGWDDDHRHLFRVGLEAIRAHPWTYLSGVGTTLGELVNQRYAGPAGVGWVGEIELPDGPADATLGAAHGGRRLPASVQQSPSVYAIALVNNWALAAASPRFRVEGGLTYRDGPLWSVFEKRRLAWDEPRDAARYEALRANVLDAMAQLSAGARHRGENVLRGATVLLPPLGVWALVAAGVWLMRRPRGLWPIALLAACGAAVVLLTALAFPSDRNYSLPFLPLFVVLTFAVIARTIALLSSARSAE